MYMPHAREENMCYLHYMLFPSTREVPQELVREAQGGEVNLDMEDHRQEEYVKPKVTVKAFSGAGNMLGR